MKTFPLNAWYVAAYDVEVKAALLARTVCNEKMVLFRRKGRRAFDAEAEEAETKAKRPGGHTAGA